MVFEFQPRGVCSKLIQFDLSDDGKTINEMSFVGGCNGNLKAICKLVQGQDVDHVCELLAGNTCGGKNTSCADQMTKGLRLAQAELAK